MRIAINSMFCSQPNVGSGQYLRGLLDALVRLAPEHEYLLLLPAESKNRESRAENRIVPSGSQLSVLGSIVVPTPFDGRHKNLAKLWFEQVGVPRAAARLRADLLHVPYFAPHSSGRDGARPDSAAAA